MSEVSILHNNNNNNNNHGRQQQQQRDQKLFQSLCSKGFVNTYRPIEFLIGIIMTLIGFLIGDKVIPYCRPFLWTDATISNQHKADTFPDYSLLLICLFTAILMGCIVAFIRPQFDGSKIVLPLQDAAAIAGSSSSPSLSSTLKITTSAYALRGAEIASILLFLLHALALNEFITGTLKTYDGRLRPDFISRLHILGYSSANDTTVDWCELTKTEPLIHSGRLSFPSGHSSTTFFCCTSLTLYLTSRLRAYSATNGLAHAGLLAKRHPILRNGIVRLLIGALPMILCFVIASSRTRDNRHHHADILAGAVIGFLSAITSWKIHFVHVDEARMMRFLRDKKNNNIGGDENDDVDPDDDNGVGMPWYLRDENRDDVGDHIPRWFLSAL